MFNVIEGRFGLGLSAMLMLLSGAACASGASDAPDDGTAGSAGTLSAATDAGLPDPQLMRPVRLIDSGAMRVTAMPATRMIRPDSRFPAEPVRTRRGETVEPGAPMRGSYPVHQSPPPAAAQSDETLHLAAARAESETVMLVLRPGRDLSGVTLRTDGFEGGDAAAPTIRWRRARYITAPTASKAYAIRGTITGAIADPLVGPAPFDADADRNAVLLLEVEVGEDVEPGAYEARIVITTDDGMRESFTLDLRVWDLTLPAGDLEVQEGGSYGVKDEASKRRYERMRQLDVTQLKYGALGIKPRHLGDGKVSIERGKQQYIEEAKYLIDELGYSVCLPPSLMTPSRKTAYAGVSYDSPHYEAAVEDYVGKMRTLYEKHGWADDVVWYIDDETAPKHYPLLIRTAKAAKRAWPDLPILLTTNEMPEELAEVIDIWVVPWHFFVTGSNDVHKWDALRAEGMTLWSYMNSLYTINAEWSLSAMRTFPVALAKYGYRGALWYRLDVYDKDTNPWERASGPMKRGQFGAAYLMYPPREGEPAGAIHSSLRWEAFRQGIDEYRMMRLLEQRAEQALQKLDPAQRDWAGPDAQVRWWGSMMATEFRLQHYRRDEGFGPRFRQLLAHETMRMAQRPYALIDAEPDRAMNLEHETLHMRGLVASGTKVTINGEAIDVNDRGEAGIFVHNPALTPGRNRFTIQLTGPNGEHKTLHREVYFNPPGR